VSLVTTQQQSVHSLRAVPQFKEEEEEEEEKKTGIVYIVIVHSMWEFLDSRMGSAVSWTPCICI